MDQNFNAEEREVIKLVHYFKKRAERLIEENKLDEEYKHLIATCDKLVEQLQLHANTRSIILGERQQIQDLVKDNAVCPKCQSNEQLKMTGVDTSIEGWKSNKYKCRKCNIEFVWNAPNNPWDMIPYIEKFVNTIEQKISVATPEERIQLPDDGTLTQMKTNFAKLKPIVEASDLDMADLDARETEIAEVVKKFKKHLQIEKIRMED